MRTLLWTVSCVFLALWSLLAWGAAGLIGTAEAWMPALGEDPLGLGLAAANWMEFLGLAGQGAILVIWALGAGALLIGTALLSRMLRAFGRLAGGHAGSPNRYPAAYRSSSLDAKRLAIRFAPRLLRTIRR